MQYGHGLKETGRLDDAIAAYETAVSIDSSQSDFLLQRGHAYKLKGRMAAALADYRRALLLDPTNTFAAAEVDHLTSAGQSASHELLQRESAEFVRNLFFSSDSHFGRLCVSFGLLKIDVDEEVLTSYVIPMFSPEWYRQRKGIDKAVPSLDLLMRYLTTDFQAGMPPGPLFDEEHYGSVAGQAESNASIPAFHHWLQNGIRRRISPTPFYSDDAYLALNKDLETWPYWLFDHFLRHGVIEGRLFHPLVHYSRRATLQQDRAPRPPALGFFDRLKAPAQCGQEFAVMHEFYSSEELVRLVSAAQRMEPQISTPTAPIYSSIPPFHDGNFADYVAIRNYVGYRSIAISSCCRS